MHPKSIKSFKKVLRMLRILAQMEPTCPKCTQIVQRGAQNATYACLNASQIHQIVQKGAQNATYTYPNGPKFQLAPNLRAFRTDERTDGRTPQILQCPLSQFPLRATWNYYKHKTAHWRIRVWGFPTTSCRDGERSLRERDHWLGSVPAPYATGFAPHPNPSNRSKRCSECNVYLPKWTQPAPNPPKSFKEVLRMLRILAQMDQNSNLLPTSERYGRTHARTDTPNFAMPSISISFTCYMKLL